MVENTLDERGGAIGHKRPIQPRAGNAMPDFIQSADDAKTALAVPGTAEVREYQAYGVLNDVQIGQSSDIVTMTFRG